MDSTKSCKPFLISHINEWTFTELKKLDQIVAESQHLHHCLAGSYTSQIVQGEYVAFHMSLAFFNQHLTLGCYLQNGNCILISWNIRIIGRQNRCL